MSGETAGEFSSVLNRAGRRIWVNPADERGQSVIDTGGDVNPHSLEMWNLALNLHDWQLVVDIGANYGEMLVGANIPDGARVIAVEPNVLVLPYLERTLAEFERPIDIARVAVSDQERDDVLFDADTQWSGKSSLILSGANESHEHSLVTVTTLDHLLLNDGSSSGCFKVDVEGGELPVLRGSAELRERLGYWAFMIEILHMSIEEVTALANDYAMYLYDMRLGRLVQVYSYSPVVMHEMLNSGWLYAQDAVLLSSTNLVPAA